jgi:hypothetical protein
MREVDPEGAREGALLFAEDEEEWRTPTMVSSPGKILEYDLKHGELQILKKGIECSRYNLSSLHFWFKKSIKRGLYLGELIVYTSNRTGTKFLNGTAPRFPSK